MSTIQVTSVLFQLQQVDLELDRLIAEKQAVTTSLQGSADVRRKRAEYHVVRQQVLVGQQAQKDVEWTLDDLTQRLQQKEQRLYNGSITNAKDLQTLQLEVQRLRAQQNREEDRLLELIDSTESLMEQEAQKLTVLKSAEEVWQTESEELRMRLGQIDVRQQELQEKRSGLTEDIGDDLLKRYDGMRRTKQGRAVSRVEQNSCQWCRVILTPSELQHVRISPELQTCTNCGRILYYDRS